MQLTTTHYLVVMSSYLVAYLLSLLRLVTGYVYECNLIY